MIRKWSLLFYSKLQAYRFFCYSKQVFFNGNNTLFKHISDEKLNQ